MVAALAIPILLFAVASTVSYHDTFALADERIDRSIDVTQEQALKILQSVNLTIAAIQELLDGRTDDEIRRNEALIRDQLAALLKALPEAQSIWLFDAAGRPLVATSIFPAPQSMDYSQENYVRALLEGYQGTYVGGLRASQFGGETFFPVSHARTSGGVIRGVTEVSLRPSAFGRFYSRIVTGPGVQYALFRTDGTMLARYPQPPQREIQLDANSGFRRTIAANPEGGFYTVVSEVDGIRRRFGVHRLPGYPLYLSAGIETAAIYRDWIEGMAPHLIFGIPATLFLFFAVAVVLRRTHRLYDEQDRREAAEGAMRQSQKMDAVGHLTGGVAHDFNNLLMIIMGNLEALQRMIDAGTEIGQAKLARNIGNAMQGARRAAALTQRLLAFSRKAPLNPRPLDLNKVVSGLSDFLSRSLGETISSEVVTTPGLWTVEADQPQIEAAIVNLALNARDAMPDGGKLTIETGNAYLDEAYCRSQPDVRPGQYAMIAVTDTGRGMSQELIDHAFEPFFTTKPAGQGTGLGLSQVYGFVKQSGGHVKIYSEIGQGTTVKVYLPRIAGAATAETPMDSPALADLAATGESVLVVEDDDQVRSYVVETLRAMNYLVDEAPTAERALEISGNRTFALLLTDVVLPGANGRELADRLLSQHPRLKVLYMTGYSRNAIVHNGRLDPGVEMIQKPVTGSELARKVRAVLGMASQPSL